MNLEKKAKKILKALASLKLAVCVILSLGILAAWGTIVESEYNAEIAQKLVYRSIYMYIVMGVFIVNLVCVMIDRLPWKQRHIGFILAHIGIITLLFGGYLTQKMGVDGSVTLEIGQTQRHLTVETNELTLYEVSNLTDYNKIFSEEVDFFLKPPHKHSYIYRAGKDTLRVLDYYPFAERKINVKESNLPSGGPGLRFQLKNQFVSQLEWLVQQGEKPEVLSLGPATVQLTKSEMVPDEKSNQIILWPHQNKLNYAVYYKDGRNVKRGSVKVGDTIQTGWMNLEFLVLNYYPKAQYSFEYEKRERPTETTVAALQIEFQEQKRWLGLNSALELFNDKTGYVLTFANRRIPIGFPIKLLKFEMGTYQGTQTAMSYKSDVEVPEMGKYEISMNEPLKHNGFTFYQASFQQDESGKPIASILSVNKDPGRWIKYLGSLLIVLGAIHLFYYRKLIKVK